jgi:Fe-S cluster biogenesis protein NfuA
MFIMTEPTPNPETLKFLPGRAVMPSGTADFKTAESATRSPLAKKLFATAGVTGVFLGQDFVTITKDSDHDWSLLKPSLLSAIMDHFLTGLPAVENETGAATQAEPDSEVVSQIKEILDTRVRPAVAQDGGDIVYDRFEDGIVYLHMQGSCSGCPSSSATLKAGVENLLKHYVPEVLEVRQVA